LFSSGSPAPAAGLVVFAERALLPPALVRR
jgi:hypothetical protein